MYETESLVSKDTNFDFQLTPSNYCSELPVNSEELKHVVLHFNQICRFCLKSSNLKIIFDDSLPASQTASDDLIEKINFTLYDQNSKMDFKLSNLICENCFQNIEVFSKFKKQCEISSHLLGAARTEIQKQIQVEIDQLPNLTKSNYPNDIEEINDIQDIEEEIDIESNILEDHFLDFTLGKENEDSESSQFKQESSEEESEVNQDVDLQRDDEHKKLGRKKYVRKTQMCPVCGKIVVSLKSHSYIHTGERRYKCKFCSKSFMQPGNLGIHIQSHLNIRKFKCELCNKDFVHRYSLKKHNVVHNKEDKKFSCSICDAKFTRQRVLRLHEKTHRQERNEICDVCGKAFLLKQGLKKHYRLHLGIRPYSCTLCEKKFNTSYNMKVHQRTHTQEKPYICEINNCTQQFSHKSSLKTHQERIHNLLRQDQTIDSLPSAP